MTTRVRENVAATAMTLVFVAVLLVSLGYGSQARLIPSTVAVASIVLMLIQLVVQNLPGRGAQLSGRSYLGVDEDDSPVPVPVPVPEADADADATDEPELEHEPGGSIAGGIAVVASFVVGIVLVGILPAVLLFVFGYVLRVGRSRLLPAAAYAVGTWGVLYVLFVLFLRLPMYGGIVGIWIPYVSG
ncbi:MAG: hypothetical protein GEV10_06035 [Streptosporangiales bacterium]|nr:hypothetical protein [Streptosporangiales bacterium]